MIVAILELLRQPRFFRSFAGLPQELINVELAGTGQHAFPAHMSVFLVQVLPQFRLQIVRWSEICMSTFGGKRNMTSAVPKQSCFAQAGSGGDYSSISF